MSQHEASLPQQSMVPKAGQHTPRQPRQLLKMVGPLVKNRQGSVLSRNTILKMDHFPSGLNANLEFHLQGAPNFRMVDLNVFGVAQPTTLGLSTILAVLNCHPKSPEGKNCTWFSTREEPLAYINGYPYVLRDQSTPLENIRAYWGIEARRLEAMEQRLKIDIEKEARRNGGLLLVHQELVDGSIVPCWIAADVVCTPREVFQQFKDEGYRVEYFRIPISPEQAPEDHYLDEYVNIIRSLDPADLLIFNCGMGVVRTTLGMVVALILRRTQLLRQGEPDPFPILGYTTSTFNASNSPVPESHRRIHTAESAHLVETTSSRSNTSSPLTLSTSHSLSKLRNKFQSSHEMTRSSSGSSMMGLQHDTVNRGLEKAEQARNENKALLRLVYVLEQGLKSKMSPRSAIEWALARGKMIDSLKAAIQGNYQWIVGLTSVLDNGAFNKKLLDVVIDRCDAVINLREDVLMNRVRHTTEQQNGSADYLRKALVGLERYFFLLAFTSYVSTNAEEDFRMAFSDWIKERSEIWSMLERMRYKGPQLSSFRPVDDLSRLGGGVEERGVIENWGQGWRYGSGHGLLGLQYGASDVVANELERHVVDKRHGVVLVSQTILKIDYWRNEEASTPTTDESTTVNDASLARLSESLEASADLPYVKRHIPGASNFRSIRHSHVYAVAQPNFQGVKNVIETIHKRHHRHATEFLWINLREEPIIYINGVPYVLRDQYYTLRNIKSYRGITGTRLEMLEEKLKEDVINEVLSYDGRILLHSETSNGEVVPIWEDVSPENILTFKEVMEQVQFDTEITEDSDTANEDHHAMKVNYKRVPITAEQPPELRDFDEIVQLIGHLDLRDARIIVNCQIGLGRSTVGTAIAVLITRWLQTQRTPFTPSLNEANRLYDFQPPKSNYQIVHSLLRVIRDGLECKRIVDQVVDSCAAYLNLRDCIEDFRNQAESADSEEQRTNAIRRGVSALKRYAMLICFQGYLEQADPDDLKHLQSFERWYEQHPELETILQELRKPDMRLLIPVKKASLGDGVALSSEVVDVVNKRSGAVLGQQTILKHDAFPGCQKMSLREKIEGAPNFRRVPLSKIRTVFNYINQVSTEDNINQTGGDETMDPPYICGCAMPTKDAVKKVLKRMHAGPGGKRRVLWTCLREEPVIYVNKKPYVLRLFQDPLKNLETTGIARERVESMENRMKGDVLNELRKYQGRILLHDEEVVEKGGYAIVPVWETVQACDVETPKDIFDSMIEEGYRVDYLRIPITDEQSPIPDVFDMLVQRLQGIADTDDLLFNCQMGRGRTTTGQTIATLIRMILNNPSVHSLTSSMQLDASLSVGEAGPNDNLGLSRSRSRSIASGIVTSPNPQDEDTDARARYLNGEYKIILQLVGALSYGKLAKRCADQAINLCDHMQNLRSAIYDYKLRVEQTDPTGPKWASIHAVGINYLLRYFYLIVFANYLLDMAEDAQDRADEETDGTVGAMMPFTKWLAERREITNIIRESNQDFS
ncbi:hypothetical protein BZG36_03823 [Bifiguratus adelaidae]|uniref:Tyrosine specific protein phosphatases domain-containing protein n=1 Tax=Bifiguratus adelaidae TaxID=1938954 RepID=A0A261XZP8_9FUNG|nr:hypothetical protein BZG36_03823 [Bifiguratus adelaidae]